MNPLKKRCDLKLLMQGTAPAINILWMVFVGMTTVAGCVDHNEGVRRMVIAKSDLGQSHKHRVEIETGIIIEIEYSDYIGSQAGFWGSETSPPFNVLQSLSLEIGGRRTNIDPRYLHDLANVASSPSTLAVEVQGDSTCRLILRGGDGIHSYICEFKLNMTDDDLSLLDRSVEYIGW